MNKIPIYTSYNNKELFKFCSAWPSSMHSSQFFIEQSAPYQFLGCPGVYEFNITYKEYNEKEDKKYIFPIVFSMWRLFEHVNEIIIPDEVLFDIKNNKCKVALINVYEGWPSYYWVNAIYHLMAKFNIGKNSFCVINGNMQEFPKDINHFYFNHWERNHKTYNLDEYRNTSFKYKKDRSNKFICLNRRPQAYRAALMTQLESIENSGILTFNPVIDNDNCAFYNSRKHDFKKCYPKTYKKFIKGNVESRLPKLFDDGIDAQIANPTLDTNPYKFYNSYLHVVPETYHTNDNGQVFYSEKIFKPILYFQPFILVSQKYSLRQFKKLGYKSFDNWIDESYDEIENNESRLLKTTSEIKRLSNLSNKELDYMIESMIPILEFNFNHLENRLINMDSDFNKILGDFLND